MPSVDAPRDRRGNVPPIPSSLLSEELLSSCRECGEQTVQLSASLRSASAAEHPLLRSHVLSGAACT